MSVDTMPAGPEMDALVAEKVFGCKPVFAAREWEKQHGNLAHKEWVCAVTGHGHPEPDTEHNLDDVIAEYSTDIAAAWCVLGRFTAKFVWFDDATCEWHCHLDGRRCVMEDARFHATGELSAPLAICRAALKAVGA
jgi:hypothetical protein